MGRVGDNDEGVMIMIIRIGLGVCGIPGHNYSVRFTTQAKRRICFGTPIDLESLCTNAYRNCAATLEKKDHSRMGLLLMGNSIRFEDYDEAK